MPAPAIPTCAVHVRLYDQNGQAVGGASITAQLDRYEIHDGFVVPQRVEAVTDIYGEAILNLWPNALGSQSSSYKIKVQPSDSKGYSTIAIVPDAPTAELAQIAQLPELPGKTDFQEFFEQAQGLATDLVNSANSAKTAAQAAQTAAAGSATASAGSATSAATQAAAALASSQSATASANAAEASRVNAGTSATNAAGSATAAAGSATAAATSATNAANTVSAIANGTAADAGPLTGAEYATVSRGSGVLKTTLTAIAQWVLQTFQGFTQSGAGAVARTVQEKLRESVSVKDFGAKGDGVVDDSAAFQAAANAANTVHVPWTPAAYLLNAGISAPGVRWIIEGKLAGPGGLSGVANYPAIQLFEDIATPTGPSQPQAVLRSIVTAKGDNTTFIGGVAGFFEARDRSDVTALNKGVLYGISVSVVPSQARNNVPYDDCNGITIMNTTGTAGAKATDALYIAHNGNIFPSSSEWYSGITIDANCDIGIQLGGRYANYGVDLKNANFPTGAAIRLGNTHTIYWRNNSNSGDLPVLALDANNIISLGGTNVSGTSVKNWFGTTSPSVQAAATYNVGFNDNHLIFNGSGCTVTLPPAASFAGRMITLRTVTANAVISASANVVPLAGGSAGTAILAATTGKWANLVSDGANWQIMGAN